MTDFSTKARKRMENEVDKMGDKREELRLIYPSVSTLLGPLLHLAGVYGGPCRPIAGGMSCLPGSNLGRLESGGLSICTTIKRNAEALQGYALFVDVVGYTRLWCIQGSPKQPIENAKPFLQFALALFKSGVSLSAPNVS